NSHGPVPSQGRLGAKNPANGASASIILRPAWAKEPLPIGERSPHYHYRLWEQDFFSKKLLLSYSPSESPKNRCLSTLSKVVHSTVKNIFVDNSRGGFLATAAIRFLASNTPLPPNLTSFARLVLVFSDGFHRFGARLCRENDGAAFVAEIA